MEDNGNNISGDDIKCDETRKAHVGRGEYRIPKNPFGQGRTYEGWNEGLAIGFFVRLESDGHKTVILRVLAVALVPAMRLRAAEGPRT